MTAIFAFMPANILVVSIDGLRASALGAYANTTFGTPALDRFAAESFLLDSCFASSVDLTEIYRALWHANEVERSSTLPRLLNERGYATTLITDERALNALAGSTGFGEVIELDTASDSREISTRAHDPAETDLARVISAAIDRISGSGLDRPQITWLHARGLSGTWDAPLEFQQMLLDEDDPSPIDTTSSPDLLVGPGDDPDAPFRYATAYAAQVMVLDACWETLLDTLDAAENEWLVMLIGARGFPLGEHGRIGGVDQRLFAEQLHVPWLIRLPDKRGQLSRSCALTTHADLPSTLIDAVGENESLKNIGFDGVSVLRLISGGRVTWRDAICSHSPTARAIRTPAWCLREDLVATNSNVDSSGESRERELYVRPDDRWEANDVAKLCPEVVEELKTRLSSGEASASRC
jgi:arylsulfatase A-like enzyme